MKTTETQLSMKNIIIAALTAITLSGCKKDSGIKCTTCYEATTQTRQEYCDTPRKVKEFQDFLIKQGNNLGQRWSCN